MSAVRSFRLHGQGIWVDVRLYELDGRWLASADTPDGPTLRTGWSAMAALTEALESYDSAIDQLLRTAPLDLRQEGIFLDY